MHYHFELTAKWRFLLLLLLPLLLCLSLSAQQAREQGSSCLLSARRLWKVDDRQCTVLSPFVATAPPQHLSVQLLLLSRIPLLNLEENFIFYTSFQFHNDDRPPTSRSCDARLPQKPQTECATLQNLLQHWRAAGRQHFVKLLPKPMPKSTSTSTPEPVK